MTEPKEPQTPQSLEVPAWEDLSPEQQQAFEEGPGWVTDSAGPELLSFDDVETFRVPEQEPYKFRGHSDNFISFFFRNGFLATVTEEKPVFQRFKILFPERLAELDQKVADAALKPDDGLWQELLETYAVMQQLVDKKDPDVMRKDGTVDEDFLTR